MEVALALLVGILVAASVYLMLARNLLRFVFGLVLLSNAANLTIFASGQLVRANPPLVPEGLAAPPEPAAAGVDARCFPGPPRAPLRGRGLFPCGHGALLVR